MWDIILIGLGSAGLFAISVWLCIKYRVICCDCDDGDDDDY